MLRHAVELLREDNASPATAAGMLPAGAHSQTTRAGLGVKRSRVQKLETLLDREADDRELMLQVISYYPETLKDSPEALRYLETRGLRNEEAIDRFKLGYANRTLGYRLPSKLNAAGRELRGRLQQLGIYRQSGHEHFNGCLVIPIFDEHGVVTEIYGRKIVRNLNSDIALHLYLPGPHLPHHAVGAAFRDAARPTNHRAALPRTASAICQPSD